MTNLTKRKQRTKNQNPQKTKMKIRLLTQRKKMMLMTTKRIKKTPITELKVHCLIQLT